MNRRLSFSDPSWTLTDDRSNRTNETNSISSLGWIDNVLRRSTNTQTQLEEIIDLNRDIEIFSNNQLNTLNPREIYRTGVFTVITGLYRHHREQMFAVPDGNQQIINLMTPEAINQLKIQKYKMIHLGLIVIGVIGLTRQKIGAKLLLILIDDRHQDLDRAIFGTMEVDMNNNIGIVYIAPNFTMDINDFYKHVKLVIQTKGYENFQGKNILLDITFLGKCMSRHAPKIKIKLDKIIETLNSTGINFIKPMEIDSSILAGHEWNITNPNETAATIKPNNVVTYNNLNKSMSIRFKDYGPSNQQEVETDEETEELSKRING